MSNTRTVKSDEGSQSWIRKAIERFGYSCPSAGVCFGMALMGIQAILLNDLALFDERVLAISLSQLSSMGDIPAFIEGVLMHQQPQVYAEWFEAGEAVTQSALLSFSLLKAKKLKNKGPVALDAISGAYSKNDLIGFFKSLKEAVNSSSEKMSHPFSTVIKTHDHAITVAYDGNKKEWIMIDANTSSKQRFKSSKEIAAAVHDAFGSEKTTMLITQPFTTNSNQKSANSILNTWKTSEHFKRIHTVTPKKAALKNADNINWLFMAVLAGDNKAVAALLDSGSDKNIASKLSKDFPLYVAVQHKNIEAVRLLLKAGANPNQTYPDGTNPLEAALKYKYLDIAEVLLQNGANANETRHYEASGEESRLYESVFHRNHEAVELLVKYGADLNFKSTNYGVTALCLAAWIGQEESARHLLAAGADRQLSNSDGFTPLELAEGCGHDSVAKLISKHSDVYTRGSSSSTPASNSHKLTH